MLSLCAEVSEPEPEPEHQPEAAAQLESEAARELEEEPEAEVDHASLGAWMKPASIRRWAVRAASTEMSALKPALCSLLCVLRMRSTDLKAHCVSSSVLGLLQAPP